MLKRQIAGAAAIIVLCAALGVTMIPPDSRAQSAHSAIITPANSNNLDKPLQAARHTVKTFADRLKSELSNAVKSDGAASAVALCQTLAPDIPTQLSDETGFDITRTSLRLRNPENAPGPWELEILKKFEKQVTEGADPSRLEHFEVITTPEGDKQFRYMKGIAAGEICLSCHGTDIKPDVKSELNRYYPDDKATGYRLGELRGAFSLIRLMNE